MKNSTYLYFISFALIVFGCNSSDKEKKMAISEISSLENNLVTNTTLVLNKKNARQLIDLYDAYNTKYPNDSLAPEYLFKAGELAMNLTNSTQAIVLLNKFENEYSTHEKYPYCIFFQAFVYENQLNNLEKAKQYYQLFIDKYPQHELADDAKSSIDNLGKPLEEIIKSFEETKKL
jgi:outer membrane protein assembly factor BamD (BamD/ComL family)